MFALKKGSTDRLSNFFADYRGEASFGRLSAGYCILAAVCFYQAPFFLPALTAYCLSVGNSLLLTGAGLYTASKGEQALSSSAISKFKALLTSKDAAAAEVTPSSATPPDPA